MDDVPDKILKKASSEIWKWLQKQPYWDHIINISRFRRGKEIIIGVDTLLCELPSHWQYNNYKIVIRQRMKNNLYPAHN